MKVKLLDRRLSADTIKYATAGSAGLDLRACITLPILMYGGDLIRLGSGIAAQLDAGTVGLVVPRSGLGSQGLVLANGTGVIDSDYRGEITIVLWNRNPPGTPPIRIQPLDRVAQLVVLPIRRDMEIVQELEPTPRGTDGFGSTGQ